MNSERFMDSAFAKLYLWFAKAKYTMGIFFVLFVFVYLLYGFINGEVVIRLDFFTAIEMIMVCFVIGVLQQLLIPIDKISFQRSIVWILLCMIITFISSYIFNWFSSLSIWYLIIFVISVVLGMIAMILAYYLDLHYETKLLNIGLKEYQNRDKGGLK